MKRAQKRTGCLAQHVVGIDRRAFPPVPRIGEAKDGKVQVRSRFWGIARSPDIPDHLALVNGLAFAKAIGVALEMGVVVAEIRGGVELVDSDASGFTVKQPRDRSALNGLDRRISRRKDVERLMAPRRPSFVRELPRELFGANSLDWYQELTVFETSWA